MSREIVNVLLIEDSPTQKAWIEKQLGEGKETEFELYHADKLAAGLDRLSEGNIDVTLLDLGLPDSHGLATFLKVRDVAGRVPTIVLTSSEDDALGLEAVRAGAQDYLLKDEVTGHMLTRVLRYGIERKRTEELLKQTNAELKRMNTLMMDREGRILELKAEVNSLLKETGRDARYTT